MATLLCQPLAHALVAPVETTLRQLLEEYGWDCGDGLLLSLERLGTTLAHFQLGCMPPLGELGLDDTRVLASLGPGSLAAALEEIARGETETVEFKSSLLFDWRRYRNDPGHDLATYRMDHLLFSVLKSVAALANTSGGTLYVGVEDDGNICGLSEDFELINTESPDYDRWNLFLRGQVEAKFFDGRAVNSAFRTVPFEHDARPFVQIQVADRGELSFLRRPGAGGGCELYIRSGTRSVPIEYQDIQRHFELRRRV